MHTPMFSLEVFPPKRDAPVGTIYDTLDGLEGLNPDFISVTYGHGTHSDRTATARIANTIHGEYGIPAVAHLTALYSDEAKIDEALDMFEAAGVSAVLALRGDYIDGEEPVGRFNHASDLATYIHDRKPGLKVFGACYPEGHWGWSGHAPPPPVAYGDNLRQQGPIGSYFVILARTALAAATMCSRLGQVSALPRVFRPQSGLIHTFSMSIFLRIS